MAFYAGPLVGQKDEPDTEEENQFGIGPTVQKKKKKKKDLIGRIGEALQGGSRPGKEFAERQKQRDADSIAEPVTPTGSRIGRRPDARGTRSRSGRTKRRQAGPGGGSDHASGGTPGGSARSRGIGTHRDTA